MFPLNRRPTGPGEILKEEYLIPLGMTQKQLADHIGCDVKVINRVVNGRASLTATVALKLAAALKTSADFWLNAQKALDIYQAHKQIKKMPHPIPRAA